MPWGPNKDSADLVVVAGKDIGNDKTEVREGVAPIATPLPLPPDPILRDLVVEGVPVHPEHPGRRADVEPASFQHLYNVLALDFGQGEQCVPVGVVGVVDGLGGVAEEGQIVGGDVVAPGEGRGPLYRVAKFADVAGPGRFFQAFHGFGADAEAGLLVARGVVVEEVLREKGDVAGALAEGRQFDFHGADAVVEVAAEASVLDGALEVAVGGGDDADVGVGLALGADGVENAAFEDAEEAGLILRGELADFIEEEGALVGQREAAEAFLVGGGESAFFVAEHLAFEEVIGDGSAVDRDERAGGAGRSLVEHLRGELFARAGLAGNEDVQRRAGHVANEAPGFFDGAAFAQQGPAPGGAFIQRGDFILQRVHVAKGLVVGRGNLCDGQEKVEVAFVVGALSRGAADDERADGFAADAEGRGHDEVQAPGPLLPGADGREKRFPVTQDFIKGGEEAPIAVDMLRVPVDGALEGGIRVGDLGRRTAQGNSRAVGTQGLCDGGQAVLVEFGASDALAQGPPKFEEFHQTRQGLGLTLQQRGGKVFAVKLHGVIEKAQGHIAQLAVGGRTGGRCATGDHKDRTAEGDGVAGTDDALLHRFAVDERQVAAAQVLHVDGVVTLVDPAVASRHDGIADDDVAAQAPPDDEGLGCNSPVDTTMQTRLRC